MTKTFTKTITAEYFAPPEHIPERTKETCDQNINKDWFATVESDSGKLDIIRYGDWIDAKGNVIRGSEVDEMEEVL